MVDNTAGGRPAFAAEVARALSGRGSSVEVRPAEPAGDVRHGRASRSRPGSRSASPGCRTAPFWPRSSRTCARRSCTARASAGAPGSVPARSGRHRARARVDRHLRLSGAEWASRAVRLTTLGRRYDACARPIAIRPPIPASTSTASPTAAGSTPTRSRPATAPGAPSRRSAGATRSSCASCWSAPRPSPSDELDRLLGDAFAAGLDLDAIEAAGIEPIAPLLGRSRARLARRAARAAAGAAPRRDLRAVRLGRDRRSRRLEPQPALARPGRPRAARPRDVLRRERPPPSCAPPTSSTSRRSSRNVGRRRRATAGARCSRSRRASPSLHLRAEERRDTDRTHNRYDRAALVALAPGLACRATSTRSAPARPRASTSRTRALLEGLHGRRSATPRPPRCAPTSRSHVVRAARRRAARAHRRRGLRVLRPADPRPGRSSTSAPSA